MESDKKPGWIERVRAWIDLRYRGTINGPDWRDRERLWTAAMLDRARGLMTPMQPIDRDWRKAADRWLRDLERGPGG